MQVHHPQYNNVDPADQRCKWIALVFSGYIKSDPKDLLKQNHIPNGIPDGKNVGAEALWYFLYISNDW